ncbi:MOSC domain-containing protein [Amycolatopsis sp. WAC 04182]|uniref:MOSC domain-containing protein n=1 Tax=Amycolatopsis sp. WAC 04182 TaxID=2203198 RepID=UPI000F78CFE3|nr:MOSC domain-containing protein [Amycolatopsis sp. WAC 04182]RSN65983.1 MOSC domain-containing protein [Amycolatopsis sp. WAC 04182]
MSTLEVNEVFVGRPSVLGMKRDVPVYSAIAKTRVEAPFLELDEINLAGDDQADRSVHGGVDKAVYVYPATHYAAWAEQGFPVVAGDFGENASVTGADEYDVRVGDVWAWGDALVQVSQPRTPCFKLAMKTGRKDVIPAMIDSGRSGWYLRVLRTGEVPTSGRMTLEERDPVNPTIAEVYVASFTNVAQLDDDRRDAYWSLLDRVLAAPALSRQYRDGLESAKRRREERNAG